MTITAISSALTTKDIKEAAKFSIDRAFRRVLEDDETLDDIEPVQKTCLGIYFEKQFLKSMDLPIQRGKSTSHLNLKHDTRIAGCDVDLKFTIGSNWMIGPECVGSFCLLTKVDHTVQEFSMGIVHASPENLTLGANRDKKRAISKEGKSNIHWILVDESYYR